MSEQFLTTGDVARRLGVSSEFVRKLERTGKLQALRTAGGQRIFSGEAIERLAAEREQQKANRSKRANV